jgi:hypothetical protein
LKGLQAPSKQNRKGVKKRRERVRLTRFSPIPPVSWELETLPKAEKEEKPRSIDEQDGKERMINKTPPTSASSVPPRFKGVGVGLGNLQGAAKIAEFQLPNYSITNFLWADR